MMIKARSKIQPQTALYNSAGKKVAVVVDLIGPINSPYIVAKPLVRAPNKIVGARLYVKRERRK